MSWIDNIISWVSPRAACEREAWRLQLQNLRGAGYDAADYGRLSANWRPYNEAADLTDRTARDTIRARARDLERNSDMANEVILAFKRNVIGKGFTLQARTDNDKLDDQIEQLWKEWCKRHNCDVTGQQSFNQILRMAVERKKVDGGILFIKRYTKGGVLPFKLQMIEVDELSTSSTIPKRQGDHVVGGVEYNDYGAPVGYWIEQYAIDGWQLTEPQFYPAKDVIFYYSKKRPSQLREISDFSPTINRIRDTNEFITAVSVKERIAACLSVFIRKTVPSTGFGRAGQAVAGPSQSYSGKTLAPGMITEMNAGDDIQVVDPKTSSGDATTFLKMQQRLIGGGQGLSYEATARDMSETTYSSARQASIEDEATFGEEIELLQENVMSEIYETFIISAVLSGAISIPDFWENKSKYIRHEWVASPKKWIDPQKESNANATALSSAQKTFKQISAEQGRDWKQQIDDMADVIAYAKSKGVEIGGVTSGSTQQEKQPKDDSDAEQGDDNSSGGKKSTAKPDDGSDEE
jgi:lambda family phage portal protein